MLPIKLSKVVEALVRQLLVGNGRKDEALYFNFDVRIHHHTGGESYSESCGLHLLYYCPPDMTYVTVFSAVTDDCFASIGDVKEWKHEVTHDSCWRDVEVFSKVYFDKAKKINALLVENGGKTVAPKDLSVDIYPAGLGDVMFTWVPVEVMRDFSDNRGYRKVVVVKQDE